MLFEKLNEMFGKWNCTQSVVADRQGLFPQKLVLRFDDRPMRCPECEESDLRILYITDFRLRYVLSRSVVFSRHSPGPRARPGFVNVAAVSGNLGYLWVRWLAPAGVEESKCGSTELVSLGF